VPQRGPMLHQTIVVVDVASFAGRTMGRQLAVREGLRKVLQGAFAEAGVDLGTCTVEDRGDGKLILVPPGADDSKLADQLPSRLVAWLRRHNAVHAVEASIQLRVALHAGPVDQDGHGSVGQAVDLAFRILDAPAAKSALRLSTGVLALIASDDFYRDVIVHDPAADPDSYRRILVEVKETSTVAWLRLPDRAAAVPEPRVLDLLPEQELQRLRKWLVEITFPQLPTLVHRAPGPGVPPAWGVTNAWEAFTHLAEFNAGADGFPPALTFVELVARQVGGDMSAKLTEWNDDQAFRLRLEPELRAWRAAGARELIRDRGRRVSSVKGDPPERRIERPHPKRRPTVFVSYAQPDKFVARRLMEKLEAREVTVLIDSELAAGESFSEVLRSAIAASDATVVLMSPEYFSSLWCQAELATAMAEGKRLLPVRIHGDVAEGPLAYLQSVDGKDLDSAASRITEALEAAR
jgi:vWA-MoxR associated protein middle region 0/TIR domain